MCELDHERIGVEVSVSAEVYSLGGETLGRLVLDEFRYIREDRDACSPRVELARLGVGPPSVGISKATPQSP
jgi:hypothetical protein